MNFERNIAAPDGIHDNIEFNEYRSAKWWTEQALRRQLIDKLAPFGIVAGAIIAFCMVGLVEFAL